MKPPSSVVQSLQTEAHRLGFELFGVSAAVKPTGFSHLTTWLDQNYHGEMAYFERRREAYSDPQHVLDEVRSLVILGMRYAGGVSRISGPRHAQIASYAAVQIDYHDVIWEKLDALGEFLTSVIPEARWRGVVDTAPLLEREFAELAGLGWAGKNTMLINPRQGSYFFLSALLTDFELPPSEPFKADHCGTCRRCLEACPTDAFVDAHVLDARRCISYLTIEHRSPIPHDLREGIGDWLFGCDVCQDVCPWNRFAKPPSTEEFREERSQPSFDVIDILKLDDKGFRLRFRHTPLWRAKRRGLLRNACIVAGNLQSVAAVPELTRLLADEEPLIRGAAAWGLGKILRAEHQDLLTARLNTETDATVRDEIELALRMLKDSLSPSESPPSQSH
jgi:epoxyqueuosine reductase